MRGKADIAILSWIVKLKEGGGEIEGGAEIDQLVNKWVRRIL